MNPHDALLDPVDRVAVHARLLGKLTLRQESFFSHVPQLLLIKSPHAANITRPRREKRVTMLVS